MASKLRCPACRVTFPWDPSKGFPEYCPNEACETRIAHDRADDDVVTPFIRSNGKTKAADRVYREMETASEQRAQEAAAMLGVPASDMADLKITNLRSTAHEGDVAAIPVNNAVTQAMANPAAQNAFGFQGSNGVGFSGAVPTGFDPSAGARFQRTLRTTHAERVGWSKVGDAPALEMTSPLYRPRV